MIRANEIRETAREHRVPVTTIEKDYCIGWILNSLYQPTNFFALKVEKQHPLKQACRPSKREVEF